MFYKLKTVKNSAFEPEVDLNFQSRYFKDDRHFALCVKIGLF